MDFVTLCVLATMFFIVGTQLNIRMIGSDEHYGRIGCGTLLQSAADVFSSAPLPVIMEPDFIIKEAKNSSKILDIDIDDVLVWDVRHWDCVSDNKPDIIGSEGAFQFSHAAVTHDNSTLVTDGGGPTDGTVPQGTRPGGIGTIVTGTAGLGTTIMNGTETPDFEAFFDFIDITNEENAAGEINQQFSSFQRYDHSPYEVNGITIHKLLTAAHYWLSGISAATGNSNNYSLGADVRRMSIDVQELMFDRETLLSILDALQLFS